MIEKTKNYDVDVTVNGKTYRMATNDDIKKKGTGQEAADWFFDQFTNAKLKSLQFLTVEGTLVVLGPDALNSAIFEFSEKKS